jgi:protein phosphatase
MTTLTLPELALIVLIGASGAGKSTFARTHFKPTEVLSSDMCRGLVADDENDQSATDDAFDVLYFIAAKRLSAGRLTVIDATNTQMEARKPLVALARQYHMIPVAIVLDLPEKLCQARNQARADRAFGAHVVRRQVQELRRSLRGLSREGFRHVHVLDSVEAIEQAVIERQPLWNNRKQLTGPFDIIGDVHGCFDELCALLAQMGYDLTAQDGAYQVAPPPGRTAIFLGDLVDRGPQIPAVLKLVMSMTAAGSALCVPGNHDAKLVRALRGRQMQIAHGLAESLVQLEGESPEFRTQVAGFLDGLVSHYVLDGGKLVVAHAGMKAEMQGRGSGQVRDFALYGETTGETDEFGLPLRYNWAADYRGQAMVVYGHTPVPEAEWLNRTINIDTGCVFGGRLTALRYPELELVSVPAARVYAEPVRPFLPAADAPPVRTAQQEADDLLDIADVQGKRIIHTRLHGNVTIHAKNAAAALEVMSRFAVDPAWLIYLPPTMSPSESTQQPGLLEHPTEAFAYYRQAGVSQVICQEKHMGSRAVVIVCRDAATARRRFGNQEERIGVCYTRTGRPFFTDAALERALLHEVRAAVDASGVWDELHTDWVCLDCELLPWSAKAGDLIRQQYAAAGAAGQTSMSEAVAQLELAARTNAAVLPLLARQRERAVMVSDYIAAYRRYCWPVQSLADYRLAPFHLLASEGAVHSDKDHLWHMQMLARLAHHPLCIATARIQVDVTDPVSTAAGVAWWEELTGRGGEGMVVKPLAFVTHGKRGLIQPAIKCRGREYLRIIYGPEYTAPEHLARLRVRSLGRKRALATREFALGLEALTRFVAGEPLRRVHECVFGVLALESEPVDPRL